MRLNWLSSLWGKVHYFFVMDIEDVCFVSRRGHKSFLYFLCVSEFTGEVFPGVFVLVAVFSEVMPGPVSLKVLVAEVTSRGKVIGALPGCFGK